MSLEKLERLIDRYNHLVENYHPELDYYDGDLKRDLRKSHEFIIKTCEELKLNPVELGVTKLPL